MTCLPGVACYIAWSHPDPLRIMDLLSAEAPMALSFLLALIVKRRAFRRALRR